MTQTSTRISFAVLAMLIMAAAIVALTRDVPAMLLALAGAALIAAMLRAPRAAAAPEALAVDPAPAPDALIAGIGEAIADPLLVTRDGRIVVANAPARALLGEHVLGEDVRLAIRHPAAAERLADPGGERAAVDLVGLGKG